MNVAIENEIESMKNSRNPSDRNVRNRNKH